MTNINNQYLKSKSFQTIFEIWNENSYYAKIDLVSVGLVCKMLFSESAFCPLLIFLSQNYQFSIFSFASF